MKRPGRKETRKKQQTLCISPTCPCSSNDRTRAELGGVPNSMPPPLPFTSSGDFHIHDGLVIPEEEKTVVLENPNRGVIKRRFVTHPGREK